MARLNKISAQFAPRLIEMLRSPAYRALSLSARRVLDRVEIEHAQHGGQENGKLPVTFNHFQEYGIHRHAIAPAIREAVALGFVVITEKGRAGNAEHRSPNKFRLTYRHTKGFPGDGSHEWRQIKTSDEAETLARAARKAKAEKRKNQCLKTPIIGVVNHHRNAKSPVADSITIESAETITTYISRDIEAA